MLPKKYRLPAKDFQFLYKNGLKVRGQFGMLIFKSNRKDSPLFGFVVSKKVGNAVARHRMTRLLRAISMEAVKEMDLENKAVSFEYIAFIFCDDYSQLREEFFDQVKKFLKNEENRFKSN